MNEDPQLTAPSQKRFGRWLVAAAVLFYLVGAIFVQRWGVVRAMSPRDVAVHALTPLAVALNRYADNNSGEMPNELADLVRQVYIDPWGLISPRSKDRPPGGASLRMQAESIAADPAKRTSYVYLGRDVERGADGDVVVLYEPPRAKGDETTLLYSNGFIGWVDAASRDQFLDRVRSTERPVRWPTGDRRALLK